MKKIKKYLFIVLVMLVSFPVGIRAQLLNEILSVEPEESQIKPDSTFNFSYLNSFPEHNQLLWIQNEDEQTKSNSWLNPFKTKPGYAFLGSLVIPGFSQAANENWTRSAIYVLLEVSAFVAHQHYLNKGRSGEKAYINYINENWSVVKYAEFLVAYHDAFNSGVNVNMQDLLNPGASYSPGNYNYGEGDWPIININALRELEQKTLYDFNNSSSSAFSHVTQDYGSQQYYELAAKYYQFAAGWRDFSVPPANVNWSMSGMSPMFLLGANKSESFNDNLRTASRFTSLILLNHIVSAFDGYITVRLKNFETSRNMQNSNQVVTGVSIGIPF